MATYNYRPENISATFNGRMVKQFGKSDNGIETETIDDKHTVTRLLNGDVLLTGRINEGVTQNVYVARGSADAQFFQDCYDNTVELKSLINVMSDSASEQLICSSGFVTKFGSMNHMGADVDDIVFTIQYAEIKVRHNISI